MTSQESNRRTVELSRPVPRLGLSRQEVALAIGVSPTTVDVMVKEGVLPPPRVWHTRKVWLVREVEAAMCDWPSSGEPEGSGYFDGATA